MNCDFTLVLAGDSVNNACTCSHSGSFNVIDVLSIFAMCSELSAWLGVAWKVFVCAAVLLDLLQHACFMMLLHTTCTLTCCSTTTSFYVVGRRVSQHHLLSFRGSPTSIYHVDRDYSNGGVGENASDNNEHQEGLFLHNLPPPPAHYFKYNVKM